MRDEGGLPRRPPDQFLDSHVLLEPPSGCHRSPRRPTAYVRQGSPCPCCLSSPPSCTCKSLPVDHLVPRDCYRADVTKITCPDLSGSAATPNACTIGDVLDCVNRSTSRSFDLCSPPQDTPLPFSHVSPESNSLSPLPFLRRARIATPFAQLWPMLIQRERERERDNGKMANGWWNVEKAAAASVRPVPPWIG